MADNNKGPDPKNIDKDLDAYDRRLYDEGGTQGPFSHITSSPRSPKVEPDSHSLIRWHGDGGKVLE